MRRLAHALGLPGASHSTLPGRPRAAASRRRTSPEHLVQRVEAAEDESRPRGDLQPRAIAVHGAISRRVSLGTVAMRKSQQALGEQWLHLGGRGDAVGDYVIDEIGAHRAEIAEPRQLHRRGPQREDLASRMRRVSVEVDQQVDAVVADALARSRRVPRRCSRRNDRTRSRFGSAAAKPRRGPIE